MSERCPTPGLRYINPNAQWTQYTQVLIDPVTFWGGDDTKVSPADQRMLTNYFSRSSSSSSPPSFRSCRSRARA
jgi:hypothetical protein